MSDDMEKVGVLALVSTSCVEKSLLLDYLQSTHGTSIYDFLYLIFSDNFLRVLDMFSGETIKFPDREEVAKIILYIKIYHFCEKDGFSNESIQNATKIFSRRRSSILRVIEKVKRVLANGEVKSDGGSSIKPD